MIIKSYSLEKVDIFKDKNKFVLIYGLNQGLKDKTIKILIKNEKVITNYDEKNILENKELFIENILSKSFFEEKKIIIIRRCTDKIFKTIEEIIDKNIEDLIIIMEANNLEKKSKLRSFFEKSKENICIPFYPDNEQTLIRLAYNYLNEQKISISPANVNSIVSKTNGDRKNLYNELEKIVFYTKNGKKINDLNISKLINLVEDHDISDLVNNCLAKNKKRAISILNENNFQNEDCMLIIRVFLNKAKKILQLSREFETINNIDLTISSAKPPIFWKDKEITKKQIQKWSSAKIKNLIYQINYVELNIKKNTNNSVYLLSDFILEQSS
tara:strand:- start:1033 stop:2016 length:984 start_codon:yes stop_codon:yes gene_type:complete